MTAPATTMNAKERRKALRQQQTKTPPQDGGAAAVVTAPAEKATAKKIKTEATETTELNAKERRKLQRQQQREQGSAAATSDGKFKAEKEEEVKTEAAAAVAGERLNAKQRRLLQRKATRGDEPETKPAATDAQQIGKKRKRKAKTPEEGEDGEAKKKRIHLTLFVGQLPFKCTEAMVRKHFAEAGDITLRMLTDKKTKKFKGTAFIEVKDSKALGAALSRHHTLLNGRRINVELTASGGGNNSEQRRGKIDSLRKKQSEKQLEKTRALIQKHIDAPDSKLKADDVDERMIDYLSWFDYTTAKKALEEYNKSVSERVNNTKAFFMGILKRFRETDGVE